MNNQEELELRKKISRVRDIDEEVIRSLPKAKQRIYAEICPDFEVEYDEETQERA
jgi:hypothetical protein